MIRSADEPESGGFEFLHRAGEVGDLRERHMIGSADRDAAHGLGDADRFVFGRDHRMHAGGIGRAKDCAEVVRVLHAVENQYKRHLMFRDQRHQLILVESGHGFLGLLRIADMTVLARLFAVFAAGA